MLGPVYVTGFYPKQVYLLECMRCYEQKSTVKANIVPWRTYRGSVNTETLSIAFLTKAKESWLIDYN